MEDFPHIAQCRDLHSLNASEICSFVNATDDCHVTSGFFDYTILTYCTLRVSLVPLDIFLMFVWLGFLFVALGVAADDFFCPALMVISKTLHLSDNLAGVTLLAFGNGAPDVFSAIAAVRGAQKEEIKMAFGALLGAGVFITTVVAGSVCIAKPFKMMERPFLRDVIFYLASVFMTYCILYDGIITIGESIAYIFMYAGYVLLVIIARLVYQRLKKHRDQNNADPPDNDSSLNRENADLASSDTLDQPLYSSYQHTHPNPDKEGMHDNDVNPINYQCDDVNSCADDDEPLLDLNDETTPHSPVWEFLHAISPVNLTYWKQSGKFSKFIIIVKAIGKFIMQLTVPVVDLTANKHNWNRHLNTLHCITGPLLVFYLAKPDFFLQYIHGVFPVWGVILLVSVLVSLLVFFTSTTAHPPRYHWLFAYLGFIVAILWIQCIATEVVNLLQTVGIIFNLSYAILGLTFLAWGNSISDLIANIAMARQGYPRTSISACYGGPMFNLLLGIGIPFTMVCAANGGPIELMLTPMEEQLIWSLFTILLITIITIPFILKFFMTRIFGYVLYGLYAVFIILAVLVEVKIIKW